VNGSEMSTERESMKLDKRQTVEARKKRLRAYGIMSQRVLIEGRELNRQQ